MPHSRQPVLFIGHGSPEHGIADTRFSRAFRDLGASLPRPGAIVVVSAHWETAGTATTGNDAPRTIHDFRGFPDALHAVRYPAPGAPDLARDLADRLGGSVRLDWGLDHGTWCVLRWMFPDADVPVVQLSIDRLAGPTTHVDLARRLAPLRDQGVLIVGSGNLTHNLRDAFGRMRTGDRTTPPWAASFETDVVEMLDQHDTAALAAASARDDFDLAHPTAEHWIPLLYAAGASLPDDAVSYPIEGFDWGSLSMRAVRWDAPGAG